VTGRAGRDTGRHTDRGDLVAVGGDFCWPSAGSFVAVYGEILMAADRRLG
jgi:hypothetical protein